MYLSSNVLLGLLAAASQLHHASPMAFPAPLLEERQASTVPDFVSTYGMQKRCSSSSAIQRLILTSSSRMALLWRDLLPK